jgi:phospholipase/carboxylesterase
MGESAPVEIGPSGPARASVIWLHGLGADGHDFEPLVPELLPPGDLGVRFILPHAPIRPVTINGGWQMRAWYDIVAIARDAPQDEEGIRASAEAILALVAKERSRGVPSKRIVLAGFSQGGAIALFAGLRHRERLGGIVALSSYAPLAEALAKEVEPVAAGLPVFMAHGTADETVPMALGEASRGLLQTLGLDVVWHTYRMGHEVCPAEVADIRSFLSGLFPPADLDRDPAGAEASVRQT